MSTGTYNGKVTRLHSSAIIEAVVNRLPHCVRFNQSIAEGNWMFLGMQDFDFDQI